ncbi:hypothetical protein HZB60_10815 [candidate division KSB1 bacterium]|nr:hypothetical protein [candidate division KSB1 bacterium]
MEFAVDSTRLGVGVTEGQVTLLAPAGWPLADSATTGRIRSAVAGDTSRFRFEVSSAYIDGVGGAALIVKRFAEVPNFLPWARDLVAELRSVRSGQDIREEWLLFGDLAGVQVYAADSTRVQFSILLDTRPITGLDYIVPRAHWEHQVRSVESSLGTIRRR